MIVSYFVLFNTKELVYFPNPQKAEVTYYTDSPDLGKSRLDKIISSDTSVGNECTLFEGFMLPYAGVNIAYKNNQLFDVSIYNRVRLQVTSYDLEHLFVYLTAKDSHVKDTTTGWPSGAY